MPCRTVHSSILAVNAPHCPVASLLTRVRASTADIAASQASGVRSRSPASGLSPQAERAMAVHGSRETPDKSLSIRTDSSRNPSPKLLDDQENPYATVIVRLSELALRHRFYSHDRATLSTKGAPWLSCVTTCTWILASTRAQLGSSPTAKYRNLIVAIDQPCAR
jgi:hypothetical protein